MFRHYTRDDGGEPSAHVLDLLGIGAADAQPCLLEGVIGFGERAEHPVGDASQVIAVLFESIGRRWARSHLVTSVGWAVSLL